MELINRCPAKEGEIIREDKAFGHYNKEYGSYFLKKVQLHRYPDGQIKVQFKKDVDQTYYDVVSYDDFLNDKRETKDKIFTKEELLSDFFEKIEKIENEKKMRFLSRSAFNIFDREEMSQFFLDNLEKHKEDWPEKITIIEEADEINKNFETSKVVEVNTAEIIRGAF